MAPPFFSFNKLQPLFELDNVTIMRNGHVALDNVSFSVNPGENVAILGPNGCGKSSLVKTIARDLFPATGKGSVTVGGLTRWNLFDLRKILGIVSNELQSQCSREELALDLVISGFFGSYGVLEPYEVTHEMTEKAWETLMFLDAAHLAERRMDELSSGEGRRVLIARALVNDPKALLLDEPTTSLDIRSANHLIKTLQSITESGVGVILVTHHIEEIFPEIGRVVLLQSGRVMADGPTEAVMTSENLSHLFQIPVTVDRSPFGYHARVEANG